MKFYTLKYFFYCFCYCIFDVRILPHLCNNIVSRRSNSRNNINIYSTVNIPSTAHDQMNYNTRSNINHFIGKPGVLYEEITMKSDKIYEEIGGNLPSGEINLDTLKCPAYGCALKSSREISAPNIESLEFTVASCPAYEACNEVKDNN